MLRIRGKSGELLFGGIQVGRFWDWEAEFNSVVFDLKAGKYYLNSYFSPNLEENSLEVRLEMGKNSILKGGVNLTVKDLRMDALVGAPIRFKGRNPLIIQKRS